MLRYAQRVTTKAAREHFNAGGVVVVSDRGHLTEYAVGPSTVTHDRTRGTFDELHATVTAYGDKRQRYYALANATTTVVDLADADDEQTCEVCRARHVVGEDCPNYGNGETHAALNA